jgi:hypothetical protein
MRAWNMGISFPARELKLNPKLLWWAHVLIPVISMFECGVAIYTACFIAKLQQKAIDRGLGLETLLTSRLFAELGPHAAGNPIATIIGAILFFVLWAAALCAAF